MTSKNNTLRSKTKRTLTSILPVVKNRQGNCLNCGKCCYLPTKCIFLKVVNKKSHCKIYNDFKM